MHTDTAKERYSTSEDRTSEEAVTSSQLLTLGPDLIRCADTQLMLPCADSKAAAKTARWLMHTDTAKEHDSKEGRTSEEAAAKRSSLEASHLSDQEMNAITTLEREVRF